MRFACALVVGVAVVTFIGTTTSSDLTPLVLAEADLPAGWSTQTVVASTDTAMPTRGLCGGPTLAARSRRAGSVGHAGVSFIKDPFTGPVLNESVWTFATATDASAFMRSIRRGAMRCADAGHLDPVSGRRSTVTVSSASLSLSSETFDVAQTSSAPTVSTAGDSLYVRADRLVLALTITGYLVEHSLTKRFTQQALDKLGPALR
jgi:hypothetical protein